MGEKMGIFKKFQMKVKVLFSLAMVAALVQLILPFASVKADGPKFNFMDNDYKTLRGANRTNGETNWQNSVSGVAGDEFRGMVYLHNGMVDTTAHNVRVKIVIPSETVNKTATIRTTISSDNAQSVSDTLQLNLDEDARIEYMPGKTAWFPTVNGSAQTQVAFPNGQSGDEVVTVSGLNLGNIKGCWEFVQYVSFGFRTIPKGFAQLQVTKGVRNVSINEIAFTQKNQAKAGDILEYRVDFKNIGSVVADNVVLNDILPNFVAYIPGSTSLSRGNGPLVPALDTIEGNGLSISDFAAGETGYAIFRVRVSENAPKGTWLLNRAILSYSKISVEATAETLIVAVPVPVNPPVGKALPQSGAGTTAVAASMTGLAGYLAYFIRRRRILGTAVCQIAKNLIGQ